MKCCFCGKEVASIDEAVEAGWYPDFWQGDVNWQGPVCCDCQQEHLFTDESGEYVLKPGHPVPQAAERLVAVGKERKARLIATGKFPLGQVVATPGALRALPSSSTSTAAEIGATLGTKTSRPTTRRSWTAPASCPPTAR